MQKKIIALAVAAAAAAPAFAQSNVTVYGIADAYYARSSASGASSVTSINAGGQSASRLGFKGTEDLGGGLKAIFVLEYGLVNDADVGVGENLARQQLLGLTGSWGTAVAGRAQTTGYDWSCANSTLAGSAIDADSKLGVSTLLACGGSGRQNNAVAYISPSFGGLSFAVNHARVTEAGNDSSGTLLSATYTNGPISAGLVWGGIDFSTAADTDEYGVRASYDFGMAKVGGHWQNNDNGTTDNSKWQIFAAIPVSAAGAVHLQYAQNDMDAANSDSDAWTLAYTHSLSKRTNVYTGYTRVTNDSAVKQAAGFAAPTNGGNSSVFAVGLRHMF